MSEQQADPSGFSEARMLETLTPRQREELLHGAVLRNCGKNSMVFAPWDPCDVVYYLVSGSVKIYDVTSDGREILFRLCEPGTFFGFSAIFGGQTRMVFATAQTAARVLSIERAVFERFIAQYPQLSMAVIHMLGRRLRQAHAAIAEFVAGDVRSRLAQILLKFADASCEGRGGGVVVRGRLTHQDLANMIGATRTTVTKVVNEWKRLGLLDTSHREFVILEREALVELTNH
jgi:CRP-like cAMP-binding protein